MSVELLPVDVGRGLWLGALRGSRLEEAGRQTALVVGFALLTALGAHVRIPLVPVPITLQTFFVLLGGLMLGARLGCAAQLTYVTVGGLGAPIFAGGASGFAYLVGPTGGYLMGFAAAAWLVGALVRGVEPASPGASWRVAAVLAAGALAVYVPGVLWLSRVTGMGLGRSLTAGMLPFLPGDALKVMLAGALWLRLGRR